MPEVLSSNPFLIPIIVLVLVLLIAIPVLIRRRRAGADDVLPPPELGQSIDYTSLPYEEPTGLADRFRRLSIGAKLLIFLIPLVLIVAAVIAVLALQPTQTAGNPTPALPEPAITEVDANLINPTKIRVTAKTTLPNGTQVTAALKENGQDFAWFEPQTSAQANDGQIELILEKSPSAPKPKVGQDYSVILSAIVNDRTVTSEQTKLNTSGPYQQDFFQVAAAPTSAPTTAPTAAATTPPEPTAPPATAPPEPTATQTVSLTATIFHGGNIRPQPRIENTPNLPQVHAGEVVTLLEKTANGNWYRVIAPEGTGWVSVTLLRIDAGVVNQVPVAGQTPPPTPATTPSGLTATVSHGGHVRETPVTGRPVDEVNAGETVTLLEKTADGAWYRLTDVRGKSGWVHVSLLKIDPAVAKQVPVAQ